MPESILGTNYKKALENIPGDPVARSSPRKERDAVDS